MLFTKYGFRTILINIEERIFYTRLRLIKPDDIRGITNYFIQRGSLWTLGSL